MSSRLRQNTSQGMSISGSARAIAGALLVAAGVNAVLWCGVDATSAHAAPIQVQDPAPDASADVKESTEPVYVRDSAIAQEKLALARKMARLKAWYKAADLYQEVMEKYHDRVVADGADSHGVISRYTSVGKTVLEEICKWPEEGLDVYRERYESKAAELVRNAKPDDLFSLHKAFDLYFVTDAGKQAGLRLIDAHMEHGEYAAAAWIGDRLLNLHPRLLTERPGVLFRTALAYALSGNKEKSAERAAKLTADFPKEMGVLRGKDVVLADALPPLLEQIARESTGPTMVGATDAWPMVGGNPSRSLVSPAKATADTHLFTIPLAKPKYADLPSNQRQALLNSTEMAARNGSLLGILPVTDRGELFFQDGSRVYGISLDSGLPLPGWARTHGGTDDGQYVLPNAWGPARTVQQTLTLTDRQVLAVMGQPDRQAQMLLGMVPKGEPRLVCLDRGTGQELWTVTLSSPGTDIPKNDDEKAIRSLQFSGSPLVVGDNVLVIARTNRQGQGEDCYVLAFDLSNGKYRWGCYIASSGAGAGAMFGMPTEPSDTTSHLAYADGRVYVQTNLGALAALDAYSGTIAWLDIYPLDLPQVNSDPRFRFNPMWNQMQQSKKRFKPWMFNPVVVQDGKLFMLPTEGKHLMIYDAGTGQEIKRISLDQLGHWQDATSQDADNITTLVGVKGDKLIVAGETRMLCFNWKTYDEDTFPGANDSMIAWPFFPPPACPIRGRAFMTADAVYVPCEDRLRRVDVRNGVGLHDYPEYPRSWEEGEGPGNVLVSGEDVILATANAVNVYTDLGRARQRLDREVATAPADPAPRLRYAEVLFAAGQGAAAMKRLDEAIELLGGLEKMQPGAARDRAFSDALNFARRTTAEGADEDARGKEFYDRAAAAALTPRQQVQYRICRAHFDDKSKDPAAAVKLYQEILSDASMRPVALVDEQTNAPAQAQDVAERGIDALIKTSGQMVYAPFQEQAAKAMTAAADTADPQAQASQLLKIAQTYPNSTVAPQAMLAAADAYESAGQPRSAIRALRQMWFKYPQSPDRLRISEGIARNYLAVSDRNRADMVSAAAARLVQGALTGDAKLTRALKLPDGTVVAGAGTSFSDALVLIRKIHSQESDRSLPDFHLPILGNVPARVAHGDRPKAFAGQKSGSTIDAATMPVLDGATALVLPERDFARNDRILAWGPAGLGIYAAGQTQPLAINRELPSTGLAAAEAPRGVAWAGDTALVFRGTHLTSINPSGKTTWDIDFSKLATLEVVRAGNSTNAEAPKGDTAMVNGQVIFNAAPGQLILNNRGGMQGRIIVRNGVAQLVQPGAAPADAQTPPEPAQPLPPSGAGEQVVDVHPVGDRALVTTTAGRLLSIDLSTGKVAWQTRLSEHAPDRLVATEDFTVAKVSDDSAVRLCALDTYTGRLLGNPKIFYKQTGQTPVNLALSVEGTLVYTLPDRLCLKDLYRNWESEEAKQVVGRPGQPLYAGATEPGQLLISEGRILALADSFGGMGTSANEKYVRVHSLETGQPLSLEYDAPDGSHKIDKVLTTGAKDWNVILRTVGSHLYIVGPQNVFGYDLDHPDQTWQGTSGFFSEMGQNFTNFRDAFIGQNHLVLLDQPTGPADPASAPYRLHAYARYHLDANGASAGEVGRLDFSIDILDAAGIAPQWQASDGGFYFTSADGKVHMLRGSRAGK